MPTYLDPSIITREFDLSPSVCQMAGDLRKTPRGRSLEGVYSETKWGASIESKNFKDISGGIKQAIHRLSKNSERLARIHAEGGNVTLIVNLPGDINIGDIFMPDLLRRFADLHIGLGVEVFPKVV